MTTHQHQHRTDDATIDGTDLLAEIRAQLGFGPGSASTPAQAAPAAPAPTDEEFTIDGFGLLRRLLAEADADPLGIDHAPVAKRGPGPAIEPPTGRWVPPGPVVTEALFEAKPGRWQLAAVIGAFALGVAATALAMWLLGWGLGV